ncbi:MAG: MerR family transcriptional regulator [Saprospiraceae bacterium]|nr:MerR family transcriptional regulator [Saprospiraceae bacterium]
MLIGELSRRTNLSRDTIRYYEKRGLIKADPSISEFNNYKQYSGAVLRRLLLIKESKTYGFSLKEIGELLELIDMDEANCQVFEEKVRIKLLEIERQIQALRKMQQQIFQKAERAKLICQPQIMNGNCPVLTSVSNSH